MLKKKRLNIEGEATRRCNIPDSYNRLVGRDKMSGMKSFFNTLPQVKRRQDVELGPK